MKFFNFKKFFLIILLTTVSLSSVSAQENVDFMRSTGKINVAVAVILLIFFGIVWYLFRLERKLTKLEQQIKDDQ